MSDFAKKTPSNVCPPVTQGSVDYAKFFQELSKNSPSSAILVTQEKYHMRFIPKSATRALPKALMDYRPLPSISANELEDACMGFTFQELTPSHIATVERETRKQSGSRIWFRQRAGRITASKVKQVLGTKCDNPSKSLIKSICYPDAYQFSTAATR